MAMNDVLGSFGASQMAGMPQGQPGQNESAALQQTLARLLGRMGQSHIMPPAGAQAPRPQQPYDMSEKGSKMGEMGSFMNNLGIGIQNAVSAHKEKQLRVATADYQGLESAYEQAQVAAGDPNAPDYQQKVQQIFQQHPITQAILGDPKKMKNMAKAFSQDWLNPEKTSIYGEALKRKMETDKAGKMVKAMRALHMMPKPQPQLDPSQRQQMIGELAQRLPISPIEGANPQQMGTVVREMTSLIKALQEKYDVKVAQNPDGKPAFFAINKTDPTSGAIPIKVEDAKTGEKKDLMAADKTMAGGKTGDIFSVNGKPYGVRLQGRTLSISDFAQLDGKTQGWVTAKLLEANQRWVEGNVEKEKVARIRGEMYNKGREYPVYDRESKQFRMATPADIATNPARYGPASQEQNAMLREGIFGDINYNIDNIEKALNGLKHDFSPTDRAALIAALKSDDPSVMAQFVGGTVVANMSPDMQEFVATVKSANENALSLRVVGGMGQASDMVRRAIQDLVPSKGPSKEFAKRQLKLLHGTVNRLHQAVPLTQLPQPVQEDKVYGKDDIPD